MLGGVVLRGRGLVGTDAVTAISKSTEMFIEWFARKAADEAQRRKQGDDGKTIIKYEDVYAARKADDETLSFLDGIVPPPHYVQK